MTTKTRLSALEKRGRANPAGSRNIALYDGYDAAGRFYSPAEIDALDKSGVLIIHVVYDETEPPDRRDDCAKVQNGD